MGGFNIAKGSREYRNNLDKRKSMSLMGMFDLSFVYTCNIAIYDSHVVLLFWLSAQIEWRVFCCFYFLFFYMGKNISGESIFQSSSLPQRRQLVATC